MDWKRYLPGLLIGAVALFAIFRLSKSGNGRAPIVGNALIPANPPQVPPDSRDPSRVAAFGQLAGVALGGQRLQEQAASIAANLELGRFRLQEQTAALQAGASRDLGAQQTALELERIRQAGAQNRLSAEIADRAFDRELQSRALDQTFELARQGNIQQGIGSLLGGLLGMLRNQSRPSSGSGGAGQGSPRPQFPQPQPRMRFPSITIPGIGPFLTPPFVPEYPNFNPTFPGFDFSSFGPSPSYDFPFLGMPFPEFDFGEFPSYGGGFSEFPELSFPGDPGFIDPYDFGSFGGDYFLTDPFDFGYGGGGFGDFGGFGGGDYFADFGSAYEYIA